MIEPHTPHIAKHDLKADEQQLASGKKPVKIKPLIWISLAALIGLIAFGAIPRIIQQQLLIGHTRAQLSEAPSVSVVIAQPGSPIQEFVLPGSTQAINDAPIYARVDGYLHKRYVDIGDHVHAGQDMADIDTPELDKQVQAASSAIEQSEANLDNTKHALAKAKEDAVSAAALVQKATTDLNFYTTELNRYNELVKQGAVSFEDRDSHLQAYNGGVSTLNSVVATEKSARANINSAKAAVRVAQSAMDTAQFQHDQIYATRAFKSVRAPFDGIVIKCNVDEGALITSGSNTGNTLLFEVAQTDILRVWVYVPEQYIPYIHLGEEVRLDFQEYPGRDFVGKVSNISGGVDPVSRSLQVEVQISNSDHTLLPGMYAQARFESPSLVRLAVIPATTVQTRADGAFVYTVDNQNRVHMHKLTIGRDLGGKIEVVKGVKTGDRVIISPSDDIQDGLLVNPVLAPVAPKNNEKPAKQ